MTERIHTIDFFEEIHKICKNSKLSISDKYPKYRRLLDIVCKDLTVKEPIQFSNLFSRLSFLIDKYKLDDRKKFQINSFRVTANKVIHDGYEPSEKEHLTHCKALCETISVFYNLIIPKECVLLFPKEEIIKPPVAKKNVTLKKIRVTVEEIRENILVCYQDEIESIDKVVVRINVLGVNDAFDFLNNLWTGAQLNLLNVEVDELGRFVPKIIILEPDYLVDISGIAECFQDYGFTHLHYLKSKFIPAPNSKHIRLGNYANRVIDTLINEGINEENTWLSILIEEFKNYPFEYTVCFKNLPEEFNQFLSDCQSQFSNLNSVINNDFPQPGINISLDDVTLEPSFLSEDYGIQGRLDILVENDHNCKIIELKSGKPPFPDRGYNITESNKRQLYLYYQILHSVFSIPFEQITNRIKGYILYSKPAENNLRYDQPNLKQIQEIFNLRNNIIVNEHQLANAESIDFVENIMLSYSSENVILGAVGAAFLAFILPPINTFRTLLVNLNNLEKKYFYSFISFIAREQYYSKIGNSDYDSTNGLANLWLNSFEDKKEKFDILFDLKIISNDADNDLISITFNRNKELNNFVNFRTGDICVLYPKKGKDYDVRTNRIIKCTLTNITNKTVTIKLRDKQRKLKFFETTNNEFWALEHDFMDYGILSMYRGLYSFIGCDQRKKKLIFGIETPTESTEIDYISPDLNKEQNRIVKKAINCKDYFLIWGPPGTGKTNIVLKEIVRKLHEDKDRNILIIAFTNRAVDEICDALTDAFKSNENFIRIGSEFSCGEKHKSRLLSRIINEIDGLTREKILELLAGNKIFISTIASVSGKADILDLLKFDIAIVDEASQVLEPQIIGILSKVNRFILIGDHRQLPAIVLQPAEHTKVKDEYLINSIDLRYLKNSLFERMFLKAEKNDWSWAFDRLSVQGRMHKDISIFPNDAFYQGILKEASGWQTEPFGFKTYNANNVFEKLLATRNLIFFPSYKYGQEEIDKANPTEAKLVAKAVKSIIELYNKNDVEKYNPDKTIGIITPFRNQIAVIKNTLEEEGIKDFERIVVDTVERFQGGQKDVIIFSFAINNPYQLNSLVNLADDGIVDRKLNVAITRARKQLILIGDASILSVNFNYFRIIEFIKSKSGYINFGIEDVLANKFSLVNLDFEDLPDTSIYEPDIQFQQIYDKQIIQVLRNDPRTTEFPGKVLGESSDFNRNNLIAYGRAVFDQYVLDRTPQDKVNLYCFYNMRKHYFSAMRIFDGNSEMLTQKMMQVNKRTIFVDIGCGPATAGIAFNQYLKKEIDNFYFNYYGIDISKAMLKKAEDFLEAGFLTQNCRYSLFETFGEFKNYIADQALSLPKLLIFNFSYFFSNISSMESQELANQINNFIESNPLNQYLIIYQNPASENRNYNYNLFKKALTGFNMLVRKTETISYVNQHQSFYDKKETFIFEILSKN